MSTLHESRRRFMAVCAGAGLGTTLVPGILWARMQDAATQALTPAMVAEALRLSGVDLPDAEQQALVESANRNLTQYRELRGLTIPNDVSPPFHFSPMVPGLKVDRARVPFAMSAAPRVRRPASLDAVAFWPVRHLAELIRTRQVTSLELTEMYMARLHRHNATLNNVVSFLDDLGRAEARRADAEIAAGRYKGPLHGIPWGAKDIISVKGHPTTWGSAAFKDQQFDYDATIVEQLRAAGAVLIAKLATGELAAGDNWFGGQTKSPWDPTQGSSGSSAGPASATAAGGVAFAIGSETSGSILSPSARCGLPGLRPTFGRTSRYGVMALSWTQDRLGPICRYAEDCALVLQAICRPDDRDMSMIDVPFNWTGGLDIAKLRVGIIQSSFDELTAPAAKANADQMLETFRRLGVKQFIPVDVPDIYANTSAITVESAVFFDDVVRAGRLASTRRGGGMSNGRVVPAVEYLRSQRARMMMMEALAKATAHVDVYLMGSNSTGTGGGGPRPAAEGAPRPQPQPARPQPPSQRHFNMANLAGYPALNLPNGFAETGTPTSATIYAQPFREREILALGKAYQDAARWHERTPAAVKG